MVFISIFILAIVADASPLYPGASVGFDGYLLGPHGIDVNGDGVADYTIPVGSPAGRAPVVMTFGSNCALTSYYDNEALANPDWVYHHSTSGSCPFASGDSVNRIGGFDADGYLMVPFLSDTAYFTLRSGSDYFTRGVPLTVSGSYLANGGIDVDSNGTADLVPVDSNPEYYLNTACQFISGSYTDIDCGFLDGKAEFIGTQGVSFPLYPGKNTYCDLITGTDPHTTVVWMRDAGSPCPIMFPGTAVLDAAGKMHFKGATFTRVPGSTFFENRYVKLYGTIMLTGDLDVDHDGVADILTANPRPTFPPTAATTARVTTTVTSATTATTTSSATTIRQQDTTYTIPYNAAGKSSGLTALVVLAAFVVGF